jgi:calcyphosin
MDDDNSGSLSVREFSKACKEFKVGISEQNVPILFDLFDDNKDGTLDYDEFLYKIRGDISTARMDAVEKAFNKLDYGNEGIVDINVIKANYDAKKHPDVVNGKRTEQNVLCEYLETFEAHHLLRTTKDDVEVTKKEFIEYYKNISACIDSDRDFFLIIDTTSGQKQ